MGQFPLFARVGVGVLKVRLPQVSPGPFLEAVGLLLSVPDGAGHGELLPDPVFVHWTQGPAPQLLSLLVVGLQPQGLERRSEGFFVD